MTYLELKPWNYIFFLNTTLVDPYTYYNMCVFRFSKQAISMKLVYTYTTQLGVTVYMGLYIICLALCEFIMGSLVSSGFPGVCVCGDYMGTSTKLRKKSLFLTEVKVRVRSKFRHSIINNITTLIITSVEGLHKDLKKKQ